MFGNACRVLEHFLAICSAGIALSAFASFAGKLPFLFLHYGELPRETAIMCEGLQMSLGALKCLCSLEKTAVSAVYRCALGVQEVRSSNLLAPTFFLLV
jgi:hypothetical protein